MAVNVSISTPAPTRPSGRPVGVRPRHKEQRQRQAETLTQNHYSKRHITQSENRFGNIWICFFTISIVALLCKQQDILICWLHLPTHDEMPVPIPMTRAAVYFTPPTTQSLHNPWL